jgi:hypothetical protein
MWRLYFLVFSGDERTDEAKHAHESPLSMTVPLLVLAVLATVAGFIGMPHLESLPAVTHSLSTWLSKSVVTTWYDPQHGNPAIAAHVSETTTFVLMGVALAVGAAGIGLAWLFYGKGPTPTVEKLVDGPLQPLYRASKAKLWFDEIYDAAIVKPFRIVARGLFEIVDRFIIDTIAVTGVAFIVSLSSRISRWFQNGQVQRYLTGLVIGAAAVFFITDCKSKPSFEYVRDGEVYELHANVGAGVVGKNAKITWDVNGDGKTTAVDDAGRPADVDINGKLLEGADVKVPASLVSAEVTLILEDPVSRKTERVTRRIERAVPDAPVVEKEGK